MRKSLSPVLLALAGLVSAAAGGPARAAVSAPASVPSGYVFTHHGWFHPSCVVRVGEGESVGSDLMLRAPDGHARAAIRPCAYPRYDRAGRALSTGGGANAAAPVHAVPQAAAALYDGYIVYYENSGALAVGPTLTTDWTVPLAPTNVGNQDIAFFNDILTSAGGGDILQPVLDFNGESAGRWAIESEHCCINGNDMQTTPIVVAPGDTIRGIVTGATCTATGCQSWTVTTTDVTSGKSTTLNTTAPGGLPNGVSPGSLETYGITSCDMFPASGRTTFIGNTLTDATGAVQSPKYTLLTLQGVDPEVPRTCGYGGVASGGSYTLIYGASPDGGVTDAGGSRDAASDGRGGTGGGGNDASGDGRGGGGGGQGGRGGSGGASAGASGAAGAAGGTSGQGGAGAGGATGIAGASGTSGAAGGGGRASTDAGASGAGNVAPGTSDASAGCSCEAAPSGNVPAAWVLLILLTLGLVLARPASRPGRSGRRR
jgi:hypothetical protein